MKPLKLAVRAGLTLCASFNIAALPVSAQVQALPATKTHVVSGQAAAAKKPAVKPKPLMTLKFYNVHTGDSLTLNRHAGEALSANAEWFMRDYRQDKTKQMDPRLFDLLGRLQQQIVKRHPGLSVTFDVVSSYRTPVTNATLRAAGGTQAQHSQHMRGKAMDIRVPGVSTAELRDLATCLKAGGVGYYAEDEFVHVDVARVRYWPSHAYLAKLSCTQPAKVMVAQQKSRYPAHRG